MPPPVVQSSKIRTRSVAVQGDIHIPLAPWLSKQPRYFGVEFAVRDAPHFSDAWSEVEHCEHSQYVKNSPKKYTHESDARGEPTEPKPFHLSFSCSSVLLKQKGRSTRTTFRVEKVTLFCVTKDDFSATFRKGNYPELFRVVNFYSAPYSLHEQVHCQSLSVPQLFYQHRNRPLWR